MHSIVTYFYTIEYKKVQEEKYIFWNDEVCSTKKVEMELKLFLFCLYIQVILHQQASSLCQESPNHIRTVTFTWKTSHFGLWAAPLKQLGLRDLLKAQQWCWWVRDKCKFIFFPIVSCSLKVLKVVNTNKEVGLCKIWAHMSQLIQKLRRNETD